MPRLPPSLQTWRIPEKLHRLPSVEHSTSGPSLLNADPSHPVSMHSQQPTWLPDPYLLTQVLSSSLSLSPRPPPPCTLCPSHLTLCTLVNSLFYAEIHSFIS